MKKLFVSLVALVVATMSYAQSNLVATLSHEGEISVFHGINSLQQAMAAADHGDIITLASGRYNATNITKAITLRGAGIEADDTSTGAARTEIVGGFIIDIPETDKHLTMEGIYHNGEICIAGTLNNALLQKCRFNHISYSGSTKINSMTCIHCKITESMNLSYTNNATAKFINCVVKRPYNQHWNNSDGNGNLEFTNCIILGQVDNVNKSYFQNCILNVSDKLRNTNMATYCAGYTTDSAGSPFANLATQSTNKVLTQEQLNVLFKSGTYYELTDEAKAEYVGVDDKEIGIYGGNLPWDVYIPSPQITKCNVAAKTTADGKLSVDIEVKAAE